MRSEVKGGSHVEQKSTRKGGQNINRRNLLLEASTLAAAATLTSDALAQAQNAAPATPAPAAPSGHKPNILVIFGDASARPTSQHIRSA